MTALLANLPSPRIEGSLSCGTGRVADESSKWNVDLCRDSTEESNNLLKPGAVDGLFEAPIVFGLDPRPLPDRNCPVPNGYQSVEDRALASEKRSQNRASR